MPTKKITNKKGGFLLAPITLSEPVKVTDGFTNLVETSKVQEEIVKNPQEQRSQVVSAEKPKLKREPAKNQNIEAEDSKSVDEPDKSLINIGKKQTEVSEKPTGEYNLSENELLRILDADSLDEIYELTDVLRASSLKLYATLIELADSRGRARAKNHELMSKAGIKGIATLYKQERWLMDLKLLEKKAKPGPHDGSSYVVHKLESLPLPDEIYEKFNQFLVERNS